jgi:hypothetical protein
MDNLAANKTDPSFPSSSAKFALLMVAVFFMVSWFLLRYGGRWGDNDTHNFTHSIGLVLGAGSILPSGGVYPNGYAYQALASSLIQISGVSISGMQIIAAGLLALWLVFPAWLFYREITGSSHAAVLALVILFVQPEFLFLILRGTHEKFTRGLMFLCLYFMVRGLRSSRKPALFTGLLLAFYLSAYGLIAFNIFQATSFILAMGTALGLTWVISREGRVSSSVTGLALRRLGFAVLTTLIVSFIFVFYIYPPAQHSLFILESISERVARLFLDVEHTATGQSYQYINFGWVSLPVYLTVTLANWLLLISSACVWLWWTWRWFRSDYRPQRLHELLLWSFYGAFTFLGVLSILVDISGTVIGNLQQRMFPTFTMLAAPLVAWWLVEWPPRQKRVRRFLYSGLSVLLGVLALLSTFKATNEPLVSNKWTFYLPGEHTAVGWANQAIDPGHLIWVSYDERLASALGSRGDGSLPKDIGLDYYQAEPSTRDYLLSRLTRSRAVRLGQPLPVEADDLLTYDNGQAQIYHARPRTPFQK